MGQIEAFGRIARGLAHSDRRSRRFGGRLFALIGLVLYLGLPLVGFVLVVLR